MSRIDVVPVVMAGGSGTRLWPLSRAGFPKQFLVLSGSYSLFQEAIRRLDGLAAPDIAPAAPLIVGNEDHRFLVLEQLRETGHAGASIVLEPAGRNTAPAVTLAALQALESGGDPVLVVLSADQTIADGPAFIDQLQKAARLAAEGCVVILGVTPDRPETGYGYIRSEGVAGSLGDFNVAQFVEKPDIETAERYLASGDYAWNAGMFVLKASVWIRALETFRPDIVAATRKAFAERQVDQSFVRPGRDAFKAIPSESVDYAVIERCPGSEFPIRMLRLEAGWNDLGAWDAVWQAGQRDGEGNVSSGDVILADTRNSVVHATSRFVGTIGLDNAVVVETPDAVLVTTRERSQDVKKIVAELQRRKREEHVLHRKVHRPWGWYDSIDTGSRFKVKRIQVKPGASLSLQMHHHRAEHWIVVHGTAEVTCGERKLLVTENQSTYIPLGETHRLANPGTIPLEIIEVQSGSYLGEDDIVRFEDTYGRTSRK
jgi:mannose-1-phosphate guanylyltransferase/mannose-6-phosphate isomerase